jgi:hypothetical protein
MDDWEAEATETHLVSQRTAHDPWALQEAAEVLRRDERLAIGAGDGVGRNGAWHEVADPAALNLFR